MLSRWTKLEFGSRKSLMHHTLEYYFCFEWPEQLSSHHHHEQNDCQNNAWQCWTFLTGNLFLDYDSVIAAFNPLFMFIQFCRIYHWSHLFDEPREPHKMSCSK